MNPLALLNPIAGGQLSAGSSVEPPEWEEELLAPARYGFVLSNVTPPASGPATIPTIDRPVVVIANPISGNGRGLRAATDFIKTFARMEEAGKLVITHDVQFIRTNADPTTRIADIVRTIEATLPERPPFILAFGGDGTVADVAEAARQSARSGYRPVVVPCVGGTAGDMRRELGIPKRPAALARLLGQGDLAQIDVITARINGGEPQLVIHSQGNGVSGGFFREVERRRLLTGRKSIPTYLRALAKGVLETETFTVRINGSAPMVTGEVLALTNSTSLGGVTRIPMPLRGGRLHVLPVNPALPGPLRLMPGIKPLGEVFVRGAGFALGWEGAIAPWKSIALLDGARQFDIQPHTRIELEFLDREGRPKAVSSIVNGEVLEGTQRVVLEGSEERIAVLAAEESGLRIRQGKPLARAIPRRLAPMGDLARRAAPLKLFAGIEIYKEVAELTPQERVNMDLGTLGGIFSADLFSSWRYGTTPYLAELPLLIPSFELGAQTTEIAVDAIGEATGIETFREGQLTNRLGGIGGGFASSYGLMRLVGVEHWNAAAAQVNAWMVRTIGGAGMAVEGALAGLARFLGTVGSVSFPLFIIITPELVDPSFRQPHGPQTA